MRLLITDSGLGGLSVCAGLERRLENASVDLEILYVNANPAVDGGYNALPTQLDRIAMFDRFLKGSYALYKPDSIAIACNTLSVIYEDTEFASEMDVPVHGIVDAAVRMGQSHLNDHPDHGLIIFATETTTEAGTYPRMIKSRLQPVVSQSCPDLASAITSDASGEACRHLLMDYVEEALDAFEHPPQTVAALLACTHYGYQSRIFSQVLEARGVKAEILDPNQLMVDQLIEDLAESMASPKDNLRIRFISRFPVPDTEIEAVSSYLQDLAPLTLDSLINQEIQAKLFLPQ